MPEEIVPNELYRLDAFELVRLGKSTVTVGGLLMAVLIVIAAILAARIIGGILRRLKRGRPDTWLYRQLQWRIATRHPLAAGWVGGHLLISRSGFWTTRRCVPRGTR